MTDGAACDADESPRDELSRRLRELFDAARMSTVRADQLLKAQGVKSSQSKVSRTITGRTAARPQFVGQLLDLVGASDDQRGQLLDLAAQVQAANRRLVLGRDEAARQDRIGRYNRDARVVRSFGLSGIPGLAQQEPYIRQVMRGGDRGVQARLRNQAILSESDRRFVWILPEGALGFPGLLPPAGMADQIEHLAALSRRPNIRVGIIPWGLGCPEFPIHAWDLFDDRLVVTGGETYGLDLDDPADVSAYVAVTDTLERLAVYDDNARALLAAVAARYRVLDAS